MVGSPPCGAAQPGRAWPSGGRDQPIPTHPTVISQPNVVFISDGSNVNRAGGEKTTTGSLLIVMKRSCNHVFTNVKAAVNGDDEHVFVHLRGV